MEVLEDGGLGNFRVKCEYCGCKFMYTQRDLGFRAWYPHGFVYCPQCRKPLRHKLEYTINPDGKTFMEGSTYNPAQQARPVQAASLEKWTCTCGTENVGNFCSNCGKKKEDVAPAAWFCTECGTKNTGNFCVQCGKKKA